MQQVQKTKTHILRGFSIPVWAANQRKPAVGRFLWSVVDAHVPYRPFPRASSPARKKKLRTKKSKGPSLINNEQHAVVNRPVRLANKSPPRPFVFFQPLRLKFPFSRGRSDQIRGKKKQIRSRSAPDRSDPIEPGDLVQGLHAGEWSALPPRGMGLPP
jgi:hypothetical protein